MPFLRGGNHLYIFSILKFSLVFQGRGQLSVPFYKRTLMGILHPGHCGPPSRLLRYFLESETGDSGAPGRNPSLRVPKPE